MLERLKFYWSKVKSDGYFEDFYDYLYLDSKEFYLTQKKRSLYYIQNFKPKEPRILVSAFTLYFKFKSDRETLIN